MTAEELLLELNPFVPALGHHKGGLRQSCCTRCGKWRFPQETCCNAPRLTSKEHKRMLKESEAMANEWEKQRLKERLRKLK